MSRSVWLIRSVWLLSVAFVLSLPCAAWSFDVPGFARSIPAEHFLGISSPCGSLDKARSSALLDVKGQILGSVNGQYSASEAFSVQGSPQSPKYQVSGKVSGSSAGTVIGVANRVVDQAHRKDSKGRYVYFVLVHFPASKISEMARLSLGARVTAQLVSVSGGQVHVRLSEVNGVRVVIDRVHLQVERKNRFAKTISYYVVHVPSGSKSSRTIALNSVSLKKSVADIQFTAEELQRGVSGLLMGSEFQVRFLFQGRDELGRPISARLDLNV